MAKPPKPLTLDDKIQYQTTNRIDLDTGYLGATPDDPGGCETLGFIHMKNAVLLGRPFYDELIAIARTQEALVKENVALLAGLTGKHALTGATYDHQAETIDSLRSSLALSQARVERLEKAIKPVLRDALDHAADDVHVCDREDDEVVAKVMLETHRNLYEAMKYD